MFLTTDTEKIIKWFIAKYYLNLLNFKQQE